MDTEAAAASDRTAVADKMAVALDRGVEAVVVARRAVGMAVDRLAVVARMSVVKYILLDSHEKNALVMRDVDT